MNNELEPQNLSTSIDQLGPDLQNILGPSSYDNIYLKTLMLRRHSYDYCKINQTISQVENLRQTCNRSYDNLRKMLLLLLLFYII